MLHDSTVAIVARGLRTPRDQVLLAGLFETEAINNSLAFRVQCAASVSNMAKRLGVRNAEIQHLNIHFKILQDLLRDSRPKATNLYEENKRLNNIVELYANNPKVRLAKIEKTTSGIN
jgi:hypothetical protein